jgi:hypothetical protein
MYADLRKLGKSKAEYEPELTEERIPPPYPSLQALWAAHPFPAPASAAAAAAVSGSAQHRAEVIDRALGVVYGQALGDAYGLSTEFESKQSVLRRVRLWLVM